MKNHATALRRTGATIAVVLLTTLGFAAPAYAAQSEEPTDTTACWLNLDTEETLCFADRAELLAAIQADGAQSLYAPEASTPLSARSQSSSSSFGTLAVYFLATLYADINYGGASLDITTSNSWMCSGTDYNANLAAAWNDRVSSFESYGGCRTRLASNINQGGSFYGPYTSASSLGAFNDVASSYRVLD